MWRIGHKSDPLGFPSKKYLSDPRAGRFDDPIGHYRTLYCARYQIVALREVLQGFRYSTATLKQLVAKYGADNVPPTEVPSAWLESRVLAPCRIRTALGAEEFAEYESAHTMRWLEKELASFLDILEVSGLDTSVLRAKNRTVSQVLGRSLYQANHSGVAFYSRFSSAAACYALFEGKAWLEPDGPPRSLGGDARHLLLQCCREFGLKIEQGRAEDR